MASNGRLHCRPKLSVGQRRVRISQFEDFAPLGGFRASQAAAASSRVLIPEVVCGSSRAVAALAGRRSTVRKLGLPRRRLRLHNSVAIAARACPRISDRVNSRSFASRVSSVARSAARRSRASRRAGERRARDSRMLVRRARAASASPRSAPRAPPAALGSRAPPHVAAVVIRIFQLRDLPYDRAPAAAADERPRSRSRSRGGRPLGSCRQRASCTRSKRSAERSAPEARNA